MDYLTHTSMSSLILSSESFLMSPDGFNGLSLAKSSDINKTIDPWIYYKSCCLGLQPQTSYYAVLASSQLGKFEIWNASRECQFFADQKVHLYNESSFLFTDPGHWSPSHKAGLLAVTPINQHNNGQFFLRSNYHYFFNTSIPVADPLDLEHGIYLHHPTVGNYGHDLCQIVPWLHYISYELGDLSVFMYRLDANTRLLVKWLLGEEALGRIKTLETNGNRHVPVKNFGLAATLSTATGYFYLRQIISGHRPALPHTLDALAPIHDAWKNPAQNSVVLLYRGKNKTRVANLKEIISALPASLKIIDVMSTSPETVALEVASSSVVISEPGASLCSYTFARSDAVRVPLWPSSSICFRDFCWDGTWPTVSHLLFEKSRFVLSDNLAAGFCDKSSYSVELIKDAISL